MDVLATGTTLAILAEEGAGVGTSLADAHKLSWVISDAVVSKFVVDHKRIMASA